ncbi:Protein of unknown function [Desulfonispora thiosulfatigenes DSM 11270]|uniref:DUF3231 family protein n=1 Tax=Desulfonispora thiosulfatigenes DSM 11270 TaxID=656914 RepID=A0A1W1V165_DESTI|nr:DUF3231 family protein [Desulfonispora thiosulfatigenes]SMB87089.1 Protein of unknown function [Desulfonispora thiosulfatigenes DSM 11270]
MSNIMEVFKEVIDDYAKKPEDKNPMHIGEVTSLWIYLAMLEESNRYVEMGLNTTRDKELIESLQESFKDCAKQIGEITKIFKAEGIPMPPTSEAKVKSDPNSIPMGVKMTDDEIANGLSLKAVSTLMMCATGMSQSVRNDIALMWTKNLGIRMKYGAKLKVLMKKRGWLKVPPFYCPPGTPHN